MRLRVIDVNFSNSKDWIFKLTDNSKIFFVMDENYYSAKRLKSPISRKELDSLDIGHFVKCDFEIFNGINVVTRLY